MDQKRALDQFGEQAVREVFDRTCEHLRCTISRGMRGTRPDPLFEAYASLDNESAEILHKFLIEAVDQTFAQFLHFLDEHEIPLPIELEDGVIVDIKGVSDGLATEPYSDVGWIARFSKFKDGISPSPAT